MTARVYCGTFEAEAYWREPCLAKLPSLPQSVPWRVIEAMDEMQFAFCQPGDSVLTAKRMDDAHVEYLHTIGFRFRHNRFDVMPENAGATVDVGRSTPNVFQVMEGERISQRLVEFFPAGARLEPFAVVPGVIEAARQYGLGGVFPSQDVIRSVNRKSYSVLMRDRLGIPNVGTVVEDVACLEKVGSELLRRGPFLVKDDYGVSGKGNQLIESEGALKRICKYLTAQATRGKQVRFVLEPYLQKLSDFSCQFRVEEGGSTTVISVQELANQGLAFGASCSPRPELLERLEAEEYFPLVKQMGALLYSDGYQGDVCVDSMVLEDGKLSPLVEINARKSMSLVKHALDGHLAKAGLHACLTFVSGLNRGAAPFSTFLKTLEQESLLFKAGCERGILPLTAGTLYSDPLSEAYEPPRGRLYVAMVYQNSEEQGGLLNGLVRAMERSGVHVTH